MSPLDVVVHLAVLDDLTRGREELLDEVERARAARYTRPDDVRRFALGAALLREVAGAALGTDPAAVAIDRRCATCGEPHGPPRIAGVSCSVSHAGPLVAVALAAEGRIGVDVEVRTALDHVALHDQVLAAGELAPRDLDGFLTLWTAKEALLKASGEGLRRPMTTVRPDEPGARVVRLDLGPDAWGALAVLDGREPAVTLRASAAATARRAPRPSPPPG